jgi:hypothetical protein
MAKAKRPTTPRRTQAKPPPSHLDLFRHQLHVGDRYTDETGYDWLVAEPPSSLRQGKSVAVRFRGANDPAAEWRQVWAAHDRVRVRRSERHFAGG